MRTDEGADKPHRNLTAFLIEKPTGRFRKNHQLRPYRAPSWSWASVEGSVYNHLTNAEAISNGTTFIKASAVVDLATEDPFGPVRRAVLHVQGPIFKAFLGPRGDNLTAHLCKLFVDVDDESSQGKDQSASSRSQAISILTIQVVNPSRSTAYW